MWEPIHEKIFKETMNYYEIHTKYGGDVSTAAADYISSAKSDIIFIHIDDVDHAGHKYGYGANVGKYVRKIENIDQDIGKVINAMNMRLNFKNEEWFIIIASDHGGKMNSNIFVKLFYRGVHGGQSNEELLVPIILSGNAVDRLNIPNQVYIVDIVPTIIKYFGREIPDSWNLDGHPFGLKQ